MQLLSWAITITTAVFLILLFVLLIFLLKLTKPPPSIRRGRWSSNPDVQFSTGALQKIIDHHLPEAQVLDTFFHGEKRISKAGKDIMVKDYPSYQVVVSFDRRTDGKWRIYAVGKYPPRRNRKI